MDGSNKKDSVGNSAAEHMH